MVTPIVVGTHEYQWALWPFAALFARYWGPERVWYIGDRLAGDLPPNLDFMPVPAYSEGVWNWRYWFGNGLRSICEAFAGHTLALFLPDHWLNRAIDRSKVDILADYMAHRPCIVRADLTADRSWAGGTLVETWQGLDIIAIPPWDIHAGLNGGLTFCPSLWRPELVHELIEPFWDIWKCEGLGTERMKQRYPDVMAVGTQPGLLDRTHGLMHAQPGLVNMAGLNEDDRALVVSYLPEGWKVM